MPSYVVKPPQCPISNTTKRLFRQFETTPLLVRECNQKGVRDTQLSLEGESYKLGDLVDAHFAFQLQTMNWPTLAGKRLHFGSPKMFLDAITVFREGQIFIKDDDGMIIAMLNLARIAYPNLSLPPPNWQTICGDPEALRRSYVPEGNAVVMVNISVHPAYQSQGLPKRLIEAAKAQLEGSGVKRLLGLFRPSGLGKYELGSHQRIDIAKYATLRRSDGELEDAWLRTLERNGMQLLTFNGEPIVDKKALVFTISSYRFEAYRKATEKSQERRWEEMGFTANIPPVTIWQSDLPGTWYVGGPGALGISYPPARYVEQRLLGELNWKQKIPSAILRK